MKLSKQITLFTAHSKNTTFVWLEKPDFGEGRAGR